MLAENDGETEIAHAYRMIHLVGSVTLPPDAEIDGAIHIHYEFVDGRDDHVVETKRLSWLRKHGVSTHGRISLEPGELSFRISVPRLGPKLVVFARAIGFYSDSVDVAVARRTHEAYADFTLQEGVLVHGVVSDEHEQPLASVPVMIYVTQRTTIEEIPGLRAVATARSRNAGMTYNAGGDGKAVLTFIYWAPTDEHGRYRIPIYPDGDVVIRAHPPDRAPARANPGRLTDHTELNLSSKTPHRIEQVLVLLNGSPAAGSRISISEVFRGGGPQITATVRADSKGRIPDVWLESGHYYVIGVGAESEFVEWRRQTQINIVPAAKKDYQVFPKGWFD